MQSLTNKSGIPVAGSHLEAIDGLRGLAIFMVLANHITGYAMARPIMPVGIEFSLSGWVDFILQSVISNGFFGVMIFFVISGFCIHWSYACKAYTDWRAFYWKRIWRIIPAYWFWLAVASVIVSPDRADFLSHLLLVHNYHKNYYYSILSPFWSIAIEFQIYLIYPALLKLMNRYNRKWIVLFALLLALSISILSHRRVISILDFEHLWLLSRPPLQLILAWVLGAYLAEDLRIHGSLRAQWRLAVLCVAIGTMCYATPYTTFLGPTVWPLAACFLVQSIIATSSSLLPSDRRIRAAIFKGFSFLGLISYSVYLSHDLVVHRVHKLRSMLGMVDGSRWDAILLMLILLPPLICVGAVSYYLIEKPGIRLGSSIYRWLHRSYRV